MFESDKSHFVKSLRSCLGVYGAEVLSGEALIVWFDQMKKYSLEIVEAALSKHLEKCKFAPKPADLHEIIADYIFRQPSSDEAWSIVINALDENNSIVWTEDMSKAFFIAKPVLDAGDKIGARMAFKGAYERLCSNTRATGIPSKWVVSLGRDLEQRRYVIEHGVQSGILAAEHLKLCPPPSNDNSTRTVLSIAFNMKSLSNNEITDEQKRVARENIKELKKAIVRT